MWPPSPTEYPHRFSDYYLADLLQNTLRRRRSLPCNKVANDEVMNLSSPTVLKGYGHYLFSLYKKEGAFTMEKSNSTLQHISREARKWINDVEQRLPDFDAEGIQESLAMYDTVHRMAFSGPANPLIYDIWMTRALDKMNHGEEADPVMFMSWISESLENRPDTVPGYIRQWYEGILEKWTFDFIEGKTRYTGHKKEDTLKINGFLLNQDLTYLCNNPQKIKERQAKKSLEMAEKIKEAVKSTDRNLIDAANISLQLPLLIPGFDYEPLRLGLLRRLSESPTLESYTREAYALDLSYERMYG